jgi:hypothetical protein
MTVQGGSGAKQSGSGLQPVTNRKGQTSTHPKAEPLVLLTRAGVRGVVGSSLAELWVGATDIAARRCSCFTLRAVLLQVHHLHPPPGPAVAGVLVDVLIGCVVAWVGALTALGAVTIGVLVITMPEGGGVRGERVVVCVRRGGV